MRRLFWFAFGIAVWWWLSDRLTYVIVERDHVVGKESLAPGFMAWIGTILAVLILRVLLLAVRIGWQRIRRHQRVHQYRSARLPDIGAS